MASELFTHEPSSQVLPRHTDLSGGSELSLTKVAIALLFFFSALICIDRTFGPAVPVNVDPGFYAVAANELLQGKSLYTDVWDHKPPGVFVAYAAAEAIFGYSPTTLFIVDLILALIILAGVFYAASASPGGLYTGLFAAALWTLVSGNFELEGRDPNTEPFLNACLVWAFALIAHSHGKRMSFRSQFAVALLFLIASLFKPVVIVVAIAVTIGYLLLSTIKDRFVPAIVIGLVGIVGWAIVLGYFSASGRYKAFFSAMISYNRYYSGDPGSNILAPLLGRSEFLLAFMIPLAAAAAVGLVLTVFKNRFNGGLLAAYIVSTWVAIALPGRFSVHYFQLWLPPLIIGAAWAFYRIARSSDLRMKTASFAAGAGLITALVLNQVNAYASVAAHRWTPVQTVLNSAADTADRLNRLLPPDETFFMWGNSPNLYLLTGRRPPTSVLYDSHLAAENPLFETLSNKVRSDLATKRPMLLVTEAGRPPVPGWIMQDYAPEPIYQDPNSYSIYIRIDRKTAVTKTPGVIDVRANF